MSTEQKDIEVQAAATHHGRIEWLKNNEVPRIRGQHRQEKRIKSSQTHWYREKHR